MSDSINKEISKRYYQDWDSLTDDQRLKSGTQEEHDAVRKSHGLLQVNSERDTKPRMAGEALRQLNKNKTENETGIATAKEDVYGGGLDKFDATAAGAGSKKGANRLSKSDIKGLLGAGTTKQEILDYVEANPEVNASGGKAQKLLTKFTNAINNKTEDPEVTLPTPVETPETTIQPEPEAPEPTPAPLPEKEVAPPPPPTPQPPPTPTPKPQPLPEPTPEPSTTPWWALPQPMPEPTIFKDVDQAVEDAGKFIDIGREGLDYNIGQLGDFFGGIERQNPDDIFGKTMDWFGGLISSAQDEQTIKEAKIFGDIDNWQPVPMNTKRFRPEEINNDDMMDIYKDTKDTLESY